MSKIWYWNSDILCKMTSDFVITRSRCPSDVWFDAASGNQNLNMHFGAFPVCLGILPCNEPDEIVPRRMNTQLLEASASLIQRKVTRYCFIWKTGSQQATPGISIHGIGGRSDWMWWSSSFLLLYFLITGYIFVYSIASKSQVH